MSWRRAWTVLVVVTLGLGCDEEPTQSRDTEVLDAVDLTELSSGRFCGAETCNEGETCCESGCVDTRVSDAHCGACNAACDVGETCVEGQCRCGDELCSGAELCCDDGVEPASCADVRLDASHCGACGQACEAGYTCQSGLCLCPGLGGRAEQCRDADACCPGLGCVDFSSNPRACGACGAVCGVGEQCIDGACACGSGSACDAGSVCCGNPSGCVAATDPVCDCNGTSCGVGEQCCGGPEAPACVPLSSSEAHCGACGVACDAGERCAGGACVCALGQANCDGDASNGCEEDLATSQAHCGACGNACASGEVCDGLGACALSCPEGLTDCGGRCVDVQTDVDHCGACGVVCEASEVCSSGACAVSCQVGLTRCADSCINVQSDRRHCGYCGNLCDSGEVCSRGLCTLSCEAGLSNCAGSCVNTSTHRAHCGACGVVCAAGEVCSEGVCGVSCPAETVDCNGSCVDLSDDELHCGACGASCAAGQACAAGVCQLDCPSGLEACSGRCVSLSTSRSNCGACDQACALSERCEVGQCVPNCPAGYALCGGQCVNAQIDQAHCGSCGNACEAGQFCVGGVCSTSCPVGLEACDGRCVDVSRSVSHCGSCGASCATLQTCVSGQCACVEGFADCNTDGSDGCEQNIASSVAHCGGCGVVCPAGTTCVAGVCGDPVLHLSAGGLHTCALRASGKAYCWGGNWLKQAGTGSDALIQERPGEVLGVPTLVWVEAGFMHTCGISRGGEVWCWGSGRDGQLGQGAANSSAVPVQVPGLAGVSELALGEAHSCARVAGKVWCWGLNRQGQAGQTSGTERVLVPTEVLGLSGVEKIVTTTQFTCALDGSSKVWCWGLNDAGQLGVPPASTPWSATPLEIGGLGGTVIDIAVSVNAGFALLDNGELVMWGPTGGGPLNLAAYGATGLSRVDAGFGHFCGLAAGGVMTCWGLNVFGQLGNGEIWPLETPFEQTLSSRPVLDLPTTLRMSAGLGHNCALDVQGDVYCWGLNPFNQVAETDRLEQLELQAVPGVEAGITAMDGLGVQTCVVSGGDRVVCWGSNLFESNADATYWQAAERVQQAGLTDVAVGEHHTCVVASGAVWCLGSNTEGQLGDGRSVQSSETLVSTGLTDVQEVEAGADFTCARTSLGAVYCWGQSYDGGLGLNSVSQVDVPTQIPGLSVSDVSVGEDHACAIEQGTGKVWCWGRGNDAQLGPNASGSSFVPVEVPGFPKPAMDVSAGGEHSCAVLEDGDLWCWGNSTEGQAGVDNTFRAQPTLLPGSYRRVFALPQHTCALQTDNSMVCWGRNHNGQLCDNTRNSRHLAAPVLPGSTRALEVAGGSGGFDFAHTCTLREDGSVACCGSDRFGQLGLLGAMETRAIPVVW